MKIRGTGVPKILLQFMTFLHVMLNSNSGLQMSITSDHNVKITDTIIVGIKRKQNERQSIFFA
jgi:hypothetical protein